MDKSRGFTAFGGKGELSKAFAYGGLQGQKERLLNDGIEVISNTVDLNKYKWDGIK